MNSRASLENVNLDLVMSNEASLLIIMFSANQVAKQFIYLDNYSIFSLDL